MIRNCQLIYHSKTLGDEFFDFQSSDPDKTAKDFLAKNPPGPTVFQIFLGSESQGYGWTFHTWLNKSFSHAVYDEALKDKKRNGSDSKKTDERKSEQNQHKDSSESPPTDLDSEKKLDFDECLKIFGLSQNFTQKELKKAYKKAMKLHHPDKVASLSAEIRTSAERKAKQINQAYSKLKKP